MALHLATFRTRTLTAIIFAAVMLGGLLVNDWTFFLLFSLIHFGCWVEYFRLMGRIDPAYRPANLFHRYGMMLAGWCSLLLACRLQAGPLFLHTAGRWLLPAAALLAALSLSFNKSPMQTAFYSVIGLFYISVSWSFMIDMGNFNKHIISGATADPHRLIPVLLIVSIWINDTMAYIVGSFIGKTPLSPISPKKTWEGTAGGAILAVAVVTLAGSYWLHYRRDILIVISVSAAVTGTLGDLLESKLKRMAGVKDSGSIMPGHGGFLDRFDSLLLATPCVWALLKYVF